MSDITFIDLQQTIIIHNEIITSFGGAPGIRDFRLLESAIAHPKTILFGSFAYQDIYEMAGAYCFHIIKNHPFADGNKRTGLCLLH